MNQTITILTQSEACETTGTSSVHKALAILRRNAPKGGIVCLVGELSAVLGVRGRSFQWELTGHDKMMLSKALAC